MSTEKKKRGRGMPRRGEAMLSSQFGDMGNSLRESSTTNSWSL